MHGPTPTLVEPECNPTLVFVSPGKPKDDDSDKTCSEPEDESHPGLEQTVPQLDPAAYRPRVVRMSDKAPIESVTATLADNATQVGLIDHQAPGNDSTFISPPKPAVVRMAYKAMAARINDGTIDNQGQTQPAENNYFPAPATRRRVVPLQPQVNTSSLIGQSDDATQPFPIAHISYPAPQEQARDLDATQAFGLVDDATIDDSTQPFVTSTQIEPKAHFQETLILSAIQQDEATQAFEPVAHSDVSDQADIEATLAYFPGRNDDQLTDAGNDDPSDKVAALPDSSAITTAHEIPADVEATQIIEPIGETQLMSDTEREPTNAATSPRPIAVATTHKRTQPLSPLTLSVSV